MFTVLKYGFGNYDAATGTNQNAPVIVATKSTLEDAKNLAEQQIALLRANLQVKNYFTYVIVDMRTGELVGSIVDAPPKVDWNVAPKAK